MKCLRRCLCALLCLVLSLGVCSVGVSAAELDNKPYHVYSTSYLVYGHTTSSASRWDSFGTFLFYPNNGTEEKKEEFLYVESGAYSSHGQLYGVMVHDIAHDDQTILFEKGIKTTVKIENLYHRYLINCTNCNSVTYFHDPDSVTLTISYVDGTVEYLNAECNSISHNLTLKQTFTPRNDVKSISLSIVTPIDMGSHRTHASSVHIISYFGEYSGDNKYTLTIQQPSEEVGLLEGIWNELTSGFNAMVQKIVDVWNAIIDLPSKIWGFIENGLKSLFVPDEEYIVNYKDNWDSLLENKMGAVYQVVNITLESWDNITANDVQNTIHVPEITINLPDNVKFKFGGYEVLIVPSGFEFLAEVCKVATGAFCTLLFINGLRKRYDEVMGVVE